MVYLYVFISCPLFTFSPFFSLTDSYLRPLLISPSHFSLTLSPPHFTPLPLFSSSPSLCLFNLCGCLMKSLLKWTIVALRIFIERNNQPGCVCLRSTLPSSLPPVFKEIISWRQDCERAELWAKQQSDRIGITEPWVNNPGIVGTAAANVYYYDWYTYGTADATQNTLTYRITEMWITERVYLSGSSWVWWTQVRSQVFWPPQ